MSVWQLTIVCASAAVAGAINSVAGGGTLLTFPALTSILPANAASQVIANATSAVALCPGSLSAAWGYRRELAVAERWAYWLIVPCVLGGWLGAWLLTQGSPEVFESLVPWLILSAATLFALQPQIARWTGIGQPRQTPTAGRLAGVFVFQFLVSVYGGYFGAGIGILMLAALSLMGIGDIHRMNGLKTLFATCINGVAIVNFIARGVVDWRFAIPMIVAGTAGGYVGARVARSMDRNLVRRIVIGIGFSLAAYYFYGQWQD